MNHEELLTKAKVILQAEHPFFSYLLFYCKFHPTGKDTKVGIHEMKVDTMAVDKYMNVYYNPEWVEQNAKFIKGVLVHEIMHVVLKHHPRFEEFKDEQHHKNRLVANIAMDAVINHSLLGMGIDLPNDTIMPDMNTGMLENIGQKLDPPIKVDKATWEEVYMELKKQLKENPSNPMQDMVATDGKGNKDTDPNPNGTGLSPDKVDEMVRDATNYAKLQGKLPGQIERMLDEVYNTTTPWQKILRENMQSFIPFDFNYKMPNRRSYSVGTFMPRQKRKPSVKVYVAVDTSASMSPEEITYAISEVYSICKQFMLTEIKVMFCDADVHEVIDVKSTNDIPNLKAVGGGGTDFRPIFKKMKEDFKAGSTDMLLIFSDGYGEFPNKKPSFDTIWLTTEAPEDHYPWGKVIKCNMPKKTEF